MKKNPTAPSSLQYVNDISLHNVVVFVCFKYFYSNCMLLLVETPSDNK